MVHLSMTYVVPTHVGVNLTGNEHSRSYCGCPHSCGGEPARHLYLSLLVLVVPTHVGVNRWSQNTHGLVRELSPLMWG